jgi:hypothetical protein
MTAGLLREYSVLRLPRRRLVRLGSALPSGSAPNLTEKKLPNLPNLPKCTNAFSPDVPKSKHERRISCDSGEMAPRAGWNGALYKSTFWKNEPI